MRALLHFPIIHSQTDLGTLGANINDTQSVARLHAAEQFWAAIETTIISLELDYKNLKLYQDGLPVCGKEAEIVADVANSGSRNYQLLQNLINKGATLLGTESPELLLEEHKLMQLLANSAPQTTAISEKARTLLHDRDKYIANRINETLNDGEMAILFLGLMHNIESLLAEDMVLIQPIGKPNVT